MTRLLAREALVAAGTRPFAFYGPHGPYRRLRRWARRPFVVVAIPFEPAVESIPRQKEWARHRCER